MPPDPPDELDVLWNRVREQLRSALPGSTYRLWLEPLKVVSAQGPTLYLAAPEPIRAWVERRYSAQLLGAIHSEAPSLTRVAFVDADTATPPGDPVPESLPTNPAHTFDRFVIGPSNRLAHAAALAVAELPGEAYNPLFLHGPPGLGKTHLMGAIRDYLHRNHPELNVHYTTAERFTNEFVTALRRQGPEAFKARYRELDALLIDDVQTLEGKPHTEEEFVHTFNALHSAGKQIVLSSDRPPDALEQLAERLRDRFAWGLQAELDPPDVRTRIAVLWRFASDRAAELPDPAVLQEIAARVPGNVRVLEGAMTRVLAVSSLLSEPLSPPVVSRALDRSAHDRAASARTASPSLTEIQDAVCAVCGLSREELLSQRRSAKVSHARQLAMYLGRELTSMSLAEIARAFDRDHTTVLHALRAVDGRLEPESETAHQIHRVRLDLGTPGGAGSSEPSEEATPPPPPQS
ncbi:MAG: chromosomal replication initiator protein DnaA [Solirubrobacterales bacterium]